MTAKQKFVEDCIRLNSYTKSLIDQYQNSDVGHWQALRSLANHGISVSAEAMKVQISNGEQEVAALKLSAAHLHLTYGSAQLLLLAKSKLANSRSNIQLATISELSLDLIKRAEDLQNSDQNVEAQASEGLWSTL